jgi:hypothetical protein
MFAESSSQTACSLNGPNWTNILMEADFQACGGMLLALLAKHQPRFERRSLGSLGKFQFVRSLAPAHINNDNDSLRMSDEWQPIAGRENACPPLRSVFCTCTQQSKRVA